MQSAGCTFRLDPLLNNKKSEGLHTIQLEISAEGPETNDQGSKDQGGQGPGTKNQIPKFRPHIQQNPFKIKKQTININKSSPIQTKIHPNLKVLAPVQQFQP